MTAEWTGLEEWFKWADGVTDDVFEEVADYIEKTAYKIEADAKRNAPVDTGRLRGSINTDVKRNKKSIAAETGTDVEYAETIEFGSFNQSAQPYMFPAFSKNTKKFEKDIGEIMGKEFE